MRRRRRIRYRCSSSCCMMRRLYDRGIFGQKKRGIKKQKGSENGFCINIIS
jgi:hypothetical protein